MKLLCCLLIFMIAHPVISQVNEIEGRIVEQSNNAEIPFANIHNRSIRKGTISNTDGFFKIQIENWTDTILVHAVGYQSQKLILSEGNLFYIVKMKENITELGEITVMPKENSYLFQLLASCKDHPNKIKQEAKSYYELKTVIDDKQVELVEGFFNTAISGYELSGQKLKAGRIAMQAYDEKMRMFISAESSRAILMSKVMSETPYFPLSPFAMNRKNMQRSFYLNLDRKYLDDNLDSIVVITYFPRERSGNYYKGKIWLNITRNRLVKQTMNCENCRVHPFLPLFDTDSILGVDLHITKTFASGNEKQLFNHVDFNYEIAYKSRFGKVTEHVYQIKTNALLYAYDYNEIFFIPKFEFNKTATDYRKILSLPVNDFFWEYNDEYRVNDHQNSNRIFFSDSNTVTNRNYLTKKDSPLKKGFYKEPYVKWSPNRILFRESIPDTVVNDMKIALEDRNCNLSVKIFLDQNVYKDSTNILTCTIFDPYESYYLLPIDEITHCFMNIYFDLCEIERRKLELILKNRDASRAELEAIYEKFMVGYRLMKDTYFRSVDHGRNKRELIKWNEVVKKELQIDNIEMFKLFQDE